MPIREYKELVDKTSLPTDKMNTAEVEDYASLLVLEEPAQELPALWRRCARVSDQRH